VKKDLLTEEQKKLVERIGVFYEQQGLPPAVARVSGLLMVSDRLELTFEEIHSTLNISKSAASNAINLLLNTHRLEYITKPGDRKRYFKVCFENWEKMLKERMEFFSSQISILREVHAQRTPRSKVFNSKLKEFIGFIEFIHNEIPLLFEKRKPSK
jgi:DNA-binding transcriptional regulator GbsR (MarR family)